MSGPKKISDRGLRLINALLLKSEGFRLAMKYFKNPYQLRRAEEAFLRGLKALENYIADLELGRPLREAAETRREYVPPPETIGWAKILPVGRPLEDVEREFILATFEANDRKLSPTAEMLKVARATLRSKLKQYGKRA